MSKGLGYTVSEHIEVDGVFNAKTVYLNGVEHIGFTGGFAVNFKIPNLIGLGKQSAKGYGVVRNIKG